MPQFTTVLSTAYAPPACYFSSMKSAQKTWLEAHENYQKQSFRNRCNILSSSGVQTLIIPIKHGNSLKIKEIEIEYKDTWQKKHWKSLLTCYNSSPYFTYYRDDFETLYAHNFRFLFDWNLAILEVFSRHFNVRQPTCTEDWQKEYPNSNDLREVIHPKKTIIPLNRLYDTTFDVEAPEQAYLSAFDLLFNAGPDSGNYL
jgi:hypothetical protein